MEQCTPDNNIIWKSAIQLTSVGLIHTCPNNNVHAEAAETWPFLFLLFRPGSEATTDHDHVITLKLEVSTLVNESRFQ